MYTMVYTRVHSSPLLWRLLSFFSREYVLVSWWFHPRVPTLCSPEYLHCVLWSAYTVCAGCAYTMSTGGMATRWRMDGGGHLRGDAQGWGAYAYLCPYYI